MQKSTRTLSALTAAAALTIGGIAVGGSASVAADVPTSTSHQAALIDGPLIAGPLLDLGGILNALQIGQFQ